MRFRVSSKTSKKPDCLDTLREADWKTLKKEVGGEMGAEPQMESGKFKRPTLQRSPLSLYQKERSGDSDIIERKAEKNFGSVERYYARIQEPLR